MNDSWWRRLGPHSGAGANLFCFPYAGGGSAAFRLWPAALPSHLGVWAPELPGRGSRWSEAPMKSIPTLVDALLAALQPHLNLPFIFFGHSMGAVLAFEITQALVLRGQPTPRHLIVSARRPPHIPSDLPDLHPLPNDEFIAEINRRYGGISQELLAERELFDILLPGLRADITALKSYRPALRAPLMCAISAFGGVHDRLTPRSHLDEWRSQTTGPFQVRMFPGDHFYLDSCRLALLAHVASLAAPILSQRFLPGFVL